MKLYLILLVSILIIQESVAPPVDKKEKKDESENEVDSEGLELTEMEYHRYLQEVVKTLESDPEFRAKLEKTDDKDIRSGKIADELEFVNHHVRNKLDELKRIELERLRDLATKEYQLENGLDLDRLLHVQFAEHVDHSNPHTFERADLQKLIAKTTKDLDEADKKRREAFKQYEMNKKFEQEEKKKTMTEEEKKKYESELHKLEEEHKKHEPLHHPGSQKQLEEVWEKQDHMENQKFDPRTFFYLHDLDGNGMWDQDELKTLFLKELDKLYAEGHPEDDLVERAEELERMREHVIKEADLNKDGLISYDEFLNESNKKEFKEDPGWQPLDEQQIYSEQEYEEYKRKVLKAQEIERAIARGMQHEYPGAHVQHGQQQFPPHPNQIPQQQYQQHYPQQGQYMNQVPQHNGQYQVPQQQMHPQQGQYINQVPQHQQQQQFQQQQQQFHQQQQQQHQQFQQQQQQQFQQQHQVPINNANPIPQQQNYHPNQQLPVGQVPPVQQFQQQPGAVPNVNQIPQQQQFQQPGAAPTGNQVPQQQLNQPAGQQQNHQAPVSNNNNQPPQQAQQNHVPDQQVPVASGQNQPNAQNQVPQHTNDQIASVNNAQQHQNAAPNT